MPPSRHAGDTLPFPADIGALCSLGGHKKPRRRLSLRRNTPRAACRCRTPTSNHQNIPPSVHQSLASRTAAASTRSRRSRKEKTAFQPQPPVQQQNKSNYFFLAMYFNVLSSYILYCAARFDIVVECHPLLVVCILPWAENVLEALVVGSLVDHPHTALHPDRVAAAEVCVQIRTVTATVVAAALEFLFLKKCYLCQRPRN